jgi:hypothetical protein
MNQLEEIYNSVSIKGDIPKTSIICRNLSHVTNLPFRVNHDLKIDCITSLDPYKNSSLQITLKIIKDGITSNWVTMKKSSMINGGFGVFASRPFKKGEFITIYLGEETYKEYTFKDIVSIKATPGKFVFHDEYWFVHQINHNFKGRNCNISQNGIIRAIKNIKVGEEFFWEYNRDCFCNNCKIWINFYNLESLERDKGINFGILSKCSKSCKKCNNHLCFSCYDNFQINI